MGEPRKDSPKVRRLKRQMLEFVNSYDGGCNDEELAVFEQWISSREYREDLERHRQRLRTEEKLDCIVKELRGALPPEAVVSSEKIVPPEEASEEARPEARHVDAFLYDDDRLDEFFPNATKYCAECKSDRIEDREIISHSLSKTKLRYLFDVMLPADCSDKKFLDVGSRIGAVLYGAYFYSNCNRIFGVEINKELYEIQKGTVAAHNMEARIKLINDDVRNLADLATYDVVVLNNVFEYFLPAETQVEIWKFLRKSLRKSCLVVTVPSAEEALENLGLYEEFSSWLWPVSVHQPGNSCYSVEEELEFHDMYLYEVK